MEHAADTLMREIPSLTPEQAGKVEELLSSLQADDRNRNLISLSEPAFAQVWNDPENDVYDAL